MNILVVLGTRPEAIKLAPVISRLRQERDVNVTVCATGQHRELLHRALSHFGISPDIDLDLMSVDQAVGDFLARAILGVSRVIRQSRPDWLVVQGDTSTVLAGALAAFYSDVPVAHVEAGLRSHDLRRPFPEEMHRRVATLLTSLHFAPTPSARHNLVREGVDPERIRVTGNTVIDAVLDVRAQSAAIDSDARVVRTRRHALLTCHRRENFGEPMARMCAHVIALLDRYTDLEILFPVHPNPRVHDVAHSLLASHPRMRLVEPMEYPDFVAALAGASFVITDSGGIQEEAPSLGTPVFVLRDVTERPEAVDAGAVRLIGSDGSGLVAAAQELLDDPAVQLRMSTASNPYGDGRAAKRIVDALLGRPITEFSSEAR